MAPTIKRKSQLSFISFDCVHVPWLSCASTSNVGNSLQNILPVSNPEERLITYKAEPWCKLRTRLLPGSRWTGIVLTLEGLFIKSCPWGAVPIHDPSARFISSLACQETWRGGGGGVICVAGRCHDRLNRVPPW
jgi:hypothetical protein